MLVKLANAQGGGLPDIGIGILQTRQKEKRMRKRRGAPRKDRGKEGKREKGKRRTFRHFLRGPAMASLILSTSM
jgi:hypothetical protein